MAESQILGIGQMQANFAKLSAEQMKTRIGRRMVVAAGGIVRKEARSVAQAKGLRRTGALIKNIVIKREPAAPGGTVQYNLGVRHGRNLTRKQKAKNFLAVGRSGRIVKRYEDDPYYWRFAEFGTKHQAATPFLGPALVNKATAAVDAMAAALDTELRKASSA